MRSHWKKTLSTLAAVLGVLLCGGAALFVFLLFGLMGAFPLYVTKGVTALGAVLTLTLSLLAGGFLPQRAKRWMKYGTLAVCLGCLIYMGNGAYRESIPTLDDRDLLLWQYRPFAEDNRLATLDHEASLRFEDPYAVKLDGATALYPVYAAFAQAVYPETWDGSDADISEKVYRDAVSCTGTIDAYERLLHGEVDMIFAAGPSRAQLEAAADMGREFHLTPIGREAFVFFVNSKNPVTSLTVEEIQGIYSGQITNWAEVGGKRQSIRPFQRAENSGSQTALQSLMAGLPLLEPEEEDRIAGMGGIITQVANYRNYKNAIGFSFRYYATEMVQNGDIRLLALNGVEPTRETIRDGSYPIASEFYAVTCSPIGAPAPEESHEDLAALLDWILSEEGQQIVEKTGYVPLDLQPCIFPKT